MRLLLIALLMITAQTAEWTELRNWSGSGTKTTETFKVEGNEWRVAWKATKPIDAQFDGIFQVYVYNDKGDVVSLAANVQGPGSDVSYVRGSGPHYLVINSALLDWKVTVESPR